MNLEYALCVCTLTSSSSCRSSFTDESARANRDHMMSIMCQLATSTADPEVPKIAYDCISRVAQLYYASLHPYMDALAKLTFGAAGSIVPGQPKTEVG
jgi:hypothetical protein